MFSLDTYWHVMTAWVMNMIAVEVIWMPSRLSIKYLTVYFSSLRVVSRMLILSFFELELAYIEGLD